MNPSFRSFILELPDTLDEGLLFETQALFANMQKSLVRHVDPSNFVSSIRTYDNTDIDVTAQMDVEEFYNLLFDRLEAQLLTIDAKRRFKSLYGGELIQQIKSKECVHVSERFEPFSAIQCDIKGKNNLAESLYAYVNGEVMEGDNKYKCSSCDRHVNAVRRACLKQVPDNLIFHLKRFDFNLQNMERNKINDYFAFPQRLDMRPYKMEYLNNPSADIPEDDFELVGILVHAGSAEMGHYYSYVRERPSSGTMPKWMEFNDEQVTSFDSATIGENCFGGVSQVAESQGFPMEKPFSAYMLFYERASVLRQEQGDYHALSSPRKFEVKLPGHLDEEIMTRNAMLLQRHCLFDPVHAAFALRLMNKCHTEASSARGANHNLEDATLEAILASLDHFVSRAKGIPTFPDYIALLNQRLHTCRACCLTFLEWFVEHPEALRQLLIRNPEQSVRGTIANLIGMVLRKLKDTYLHHQSASQSSMLLAVERLVDVLASFWMTCPQGMKTWTEYFTLLVHIASLGEQELAMLFEAEFLTKVLGALTYDAASNQNMATRLSMFTHKRLNAKYGSQTPAVSLLAILLENSTVDLHVEEDYPASSSSNNDFRLAADDIELLLLETQDRVNSVIDRILSFNQKIPVVRSVTSFMLRKLGDTTFGIYNAIRFGIQKSLRSTCSTSIDAALAFCESAQDVERIKKLVHHIVRFTLGIDHTEGRQLARFFSCVSERVSKNSSLPQIEVLQFIMEQIPNWAPFLLDYPDTETRRITADSIRRVLFAPDFATQMPSEEAESHAYLDTTTIIKLLGVRCLKRMEDEYVQPRVTAIKRNVSEIMDILEACRPYYETESTETLDLQFENLSRQYPFLESFLRNER
jgi:ubiquitin carboxyl-terminal hydrolase 34